ncbi:MAG: response regulator, partial [Myxococcota bacterium]
MSWPLDSVRVSRRRRFSDRRSFLSSARCTERTTIARFSGEEALELVRQGAVDLILADIMMPKMNGIDLLRAVKAIAPATEMMMMTAFGTVENAVECMREGAYDFISKPLKRAIVVRSV